MSIKSEHLFIFCFYEHFGAYAETLYCRYSASIDWPWAYFRGCKVPVSPNSCLSPSLSLSCFMVYRVLTHWSLGDGAIISMVQYPIDLSRFLLTSTPCEIALKWMPQNTVDDNIASGNALVPSSNKTLPGPLLVQIYAVIWRHWTTRVWLKLKNNGMKSTH